MEMLLWLSLVGQSGPGFANCWWIFHFFAVCAIRLFSSLVLIHRCLLEHSLHVQIYIVHCASGAVAGLCVNVDRGLNGTWRLRLGKWTAEIIINLKEKLFWTNPNRDSWVKLARISYFIGPFKTQSQSLYFGAPTRKKDDDNFLSYVQ